MKRNRVLAFNSLLQNVNSRPTKINKKKTSLNSHVASITQMHRQTRLQAVRPPRQQTSRQTPPQTNVAGERLAAWHADRWLSSTAQECAGVLSEARRQSCC